jgi:hypothetical protein
MRFILVATLAVTPLLAKGNQEAVKRLDESAAVFSEVMSAPDKGIPRDLLDKAHCIVIVPGLKTAAFLENREIVTKRVRAPRGAGKLMAELDHYSPRLNAEVRKDSHSRSRLEKDEAAR